MCGLVDIGCHFNEFVAQYWWLPYLFWGFIVLLVLVALAKVKELLGWPGVLGVLTLGAYGFGYWRGKRGESVDPLQHDLPFPDGLPSAQKPKTKIRTAKRHPKTIMDIFEKD